MKVYPQLQTFFLVKADKLYWALNAATGNIIDLGVYSDIDVEQAVIDELKKDFAICDIDKLEEKLKNAKSLLVIGDNAGEAVFDKF